MLSTLMSAMQLAAFWVLFAILVLAEYLDWFGRLEVLEARHPAVHRIVMARPLRLVILLLVFVSLTENSRESLSRLEGEQPPPPMKFLPPTPPQISKTAPPEFVEPASSLRRRTIRLADGVWNYLSGRFEDRGSHVPPGTGVNWTPYDTETLNYYRDHYEKEVIATIEEYKSKGVDVGHLENDASQNMWQLMPMFNPPQPGVILPLCEYAICTFRELAYHVDAHDQRVDIVP